MADQKILREYLISLGFTGGSNFTNFNKQLKASDVRVAGLAKGILGAAAAAQAMVAGFAVQMSNLYYASRKAESAAGNLQAIRFAADQVGVGADNMSSAVQGMAKVLREQPGMKSYLEGFIGDTSQMDNVERLMALVDYLKTKPFFMAQQIGSMFGINPDDLLLMEEGNDKMKEAYALRKKMNKEAGLNMDDASKAGVVYLNTLRDIGAQLGVLKDVSMVALLPAFQEIAGVTKQVLNDWIKIIRQDFSGKGGGVADFARRMAEGSGLLKPRQGVKLSADAQSRINAAIPVGTEKGRYGGATPQTRSGAGASSFAGLESRYGLPAGILDRVWKQESNRGDPKWMKSGAGAEGHFGFMPDTAKEVGLKNPYDLSESSAAAAGYLKTLMDRYNGDVGLALAAYNWGMGNVDKYRLGEKALPKETQDYARIVGGVNLDQKVDIHVHGVQDPERVAQIISDRQYQLTADMVRNMGSNVK